MHNSETSLQEPASEPVTNKIYNDFKSNYLELVRLLQEAAGLEHLLMLQYLYAAFSIKEPYKDVRGSMNSNYFLDEVTSNLFGVAIEEMQHLNMVNEFLAALGTAPNMVAQEFPYISDIYPFQLELKPLSVYTTATYLYIEANNCALNLKNPDCQHEADDIEYIKKVMHLLGHTRTNHLGSLYAAIIAYAKKVSADLPDFLKGLFIDWNTFENNMLIIMEQGEELHYQFFKSVFTGSHPGFNGVDVWSFDPSSEQYPSIQFDPHQTTAYEGQEKEIKDPLDRKIGWLSNLHYWIILALLDCNYRNIGLKPKYKAVGNMTQALYSLGLYLSRKKIGLPFDPPSIYPNLGKTTAYSLQIIKLMVLEAQAIATGLKDLLPPDFNFSIYHLTLDGLNDEFYS
jgi:hypothetical protein